MDQRRWYLIWIGVILLIGTISMIVMGPKHAVFPFLMAAALSLRLQHAEGPR